MKRLLLHTVLKAHWLSWEMLCSQTCHIVTVHIKTGLEGPQQWLFGLFFHFGLFGNFLPELKLYLSKIVNYWAKCSAQSLSYAIQESFLWSESFVLSSVGNVFSKVNDRFTLMDLATCEDKIFCSLKIRVDKTEQVVVKTSCATWNSKKKRSHCPSLFDSRSRVKAKSSSPLFTLTVLTMKYERKLTTSQN